MSKMSNTIFAKRTGYHHTMVSRIRNGHRRPSTGMLYRICSVFGLDQAKYLEALADGPERFSKLLRDEVFGENEECETES